EEQFRLRKDDVPDKTAFQRSARVFGIFIGLRDAAKGSDEFIGLLNRDRPTLSKCTKRFDDFGDWRGPMNGSQTSGKGRIKQNRSPSRADEIKQGVNTVAPSRLYLDFAQCIVYADLSSDDGIDGF